MREIRVKKEELSKIIKYLHLNLSTLKRNEFVKEDDNGYYIIKNKIDTSNVEINSNRKSRFMSSYEKIIPNGGISNLPYYEKCFRANPFCEEIAMNLFYLYLSSQKYEESVKVLYALFFVNYAKQRNNIIDYINDGTLSKSVRTINNLILYIILLNDMTNLPPELLQVINSLEKEDYLYDDYPFKEVYLFNGLYLFNFDMNDTENLEIDDSIRKYIIENDYEKAINRFLELNNDKKYLSLNGLIIRDLLSKIYKMQHPVVTPPEHLETDPLSSEIVSIFSKLWEGDKNIFPDIKAFLAKYQKDEYYLYICSFITLQDYLGDTVFMIPMRNLLDIVNGEFVFDGDSLMKDFFEALFKGDNNLAFYIFDVLKNSTAFEHDENSLDKKNQLLEQLEEKLLRNIEIENEDNKSLIPVEKNLN